MRHYYVYIMASHTKRIYTGVTNDLQRRVYEHKSSRANSFTATYKMNKLVYYETSHDINLAIIREKQIKGWLRQKKVDLIEKMNPS